MSVLESLDCADRSGCHPHFHPVESRPPWRARMWRGCTISAPTSSPSRSMRRRRRSSTEPAAKAWPRRIPGKNIGKFWNDARDIFGPQKFGAHIIVGMGETEHDVLALVQQLVDMGGHSHMFCFFPEKGSLMDHLPATPRDQWRRVQLASLSHRLCGVRVEHMRFDERRARGRFRPAETGARCHHRCRHCLSHLWLSRENSPTIFRPATGPMAIRRPATSPAIPSSRRRRTSPRSAASSGSKAH